MGVPQGSAGLQQRPRKVEVTEAPSAELCPVRRLRIECWSRPVRLLRGCSRARRRSRMALLTLCSGLRKSALLELSLQVALAFICSTLRSPLHFRERDWTKGLNKSWHSCFQEPIPNRKLLFVQMLKSCGDALRLCRPVREGSINMQCERAQETQSPSPEGSSELSSSSAAALSSC